MYVGAYWVRGILQFVSLKPLSHGLINNPGRIRIRPGYDASGSGSNLDSLHIDTFGRMVGTVENGIWESGVIDIRRHRVGRWQIIMLAFGLLAIAMHHSNQVNDAATADRHSWAEMKMASFFPTIVEK